jgi:hypothetical protein
MEDRVAECSDCADETVACNCDDYVEPTYTLRELEDQRRKDRIARARAGVMRMQLLSAYEILDRVKFSEGLSDTAFRDKIIRAKQGCEGALDDFLLDDAWWADRINTTSSKIGAMLQEERIEKGEIPCVPSVSSGVPDKKPDGTSITWPSES